MAQPRVSAVIPNYNHAEHVEGAVESVLGQDLAAPFEVIILDNASTDGSRDVLERFRGDPRVRLVFNEKNIGMTPNFNLGVELARGELVALCCADDRWLPSHLRLACERLDAAPDAVVCFGRARVIDGEGRTDERWRVFSTWTDPHPGVRLLREGNSICLVAAVARTAAVREVGAFDPELRLLQDYDLWLKLTLLGPVTYCTETTVDYRWDGKNASVSPTAATQKRRDRIRILRRVLDEDARAQEPSLRRELEEQLRREHVKLARATADREERRRLILDAWRLGLNPAKAGYELLKSYLG